LGQKRKGADRSQGDVKENQGSKQGRKREKSYGLMKQGTNPEKKVEHAKRLPPHGQDPGTYSD